MVIDLFLHLNKNKFADEVKDGIFGQDILPHIGHTVSVFKSGVARTCGHTLAVTHVEGQEEGGVSRQLGGHIDLFQVHRKVHKAPRFEQEQTGLGIALGAVLVNSVLIGLSSGVAFELKGDDGKAVQEDDYINALFVAGPDLLHHGEDVLAVFLHQFRVEGGSRLGVHQIQLAVGDFDAMFQHLNQTATGLGDFCVDKADDGVLQISLVNLTQILHCVRLGVIQKIKQHLPVHGEGTVKMSGLADDIAIVFL